VDALSGLVEQGSARFTVHLTRGHITGILDSVRSMILDWGGRMEKEGIVGEAMSFSEAEKEQAKQSLAHIHIRSTGNISGQMGSNGSLGAQTANDSSVFQALADAVRAGVSVGENESRSLPPSKEWNETEATKGHSARPTQLSFRPRPATCPSFPPS
jgi:hypothetical protein